VRRACDGDADPDHEVTSRLLRSTYAIVLAGGRGQRLMQLTDHRAKPAVAFAGNLRVIDFTLSNCINSGIRRVSVLTQYKAQSLIRHVTRAWSFLDAGRDEFVDVVPAQQQIGAAWYCGTADAVYQNLGLLRAAGAAHVLVLAGDHVYKMDYGRLVAEHVRRGADVTIASIRVPLGQASELGIMCVDRESRVTAFAEKPCAPPAAPGRPGMALASMGIYVFDAGYLSRELRRDAGEAASCHDFGSDILGRACDRARVFAHDFADSAVDARADMPPYWRDVGTLDAYWEAGMDLVRAEPPLDLHDAAWPIRGLQESLPPSRFATARTSGGVTATQCLVAGGCIVDGTVRRSTLFSRVRVGAGSLVEDALLLPGVTVGRNAVVRRAIVDEGCTLPDGIRIGVHADEDRARFTVTDKGVTLVTAGMLAPGAVASGS
jgi:glucose-1-phosphate adenylyltransferase